MEDTIECPDCGNECPKVDSTYSSYNSGRAQEGEHTGNIYQCDECEVRWLDDFLNNTIRVW